MITSKCGSNNQTANSIFLYGEQDPYDVVEYSEAASVGNSYFKTTNANASHWSAGDILVLGGSNTTGNTGLDTATYTVASVTEAAGVYTVNLTAPIAAHSRVAGERVVRMSYKGIIYSAGSNANDPEYGSGKCIVTLINNIVFKGVFIRWVSITTFLFSTNIYNEQDLSILTPWTFEGCSFIPPATPSLTAFVIDSLAPVSPKNFLIKNCRTFINHFVNCANAVNGTAYGGEIDGLYCLTVGPSASTVSVQLPSNISYKNGYIVNGTQEYVISGGANAWQNMYMAYGLGLNVKLSGVDGTVVKNNFYKSTGRIEANGAANIVEEGSTFTGSPYVSRFDRTVPFYIEFKNPVGTMNILNTSSKLCVLGSEMKLVNYNSTNDNIKSYFKYGYCQSGITSGVGSDIRLYSEPNETLDMAWFISSGDISGHKIFLSLDSKINNASYYAGTHTLPNLYVDYDNGTLTNPTYLSANTDWQKAITFFTPTLNKQVLKMHLAQKTDATLAISLTTHKNVFGNIRTYGYQFQDFEYTLFQTSKFPILNIPAPSINSFVSEGDPLIVAAYTGISIDPILNTIEITGAISMSQLYDYCQWWATQDANRSYVVPFVTIDGKTFSMTSGWALNVSGSLSGPTQEMDVPPTLSIGGFYEDANGVIWNAGGTLYYASRYYGQVVDSVSSAAIEGAVIGFGDEGTATRLLYNTSLAQDTLVTDANGKANGYLVYQIGATAYATLKMVVGEYAHIYATIPRTLAGAPVGSSTTPEVARLTPDAQVVKTKANAALITGLSVDVPTDTIDLGGNTLVDAYDGLKYAVTADADIDTGIPACMYYCLYGLPLSKSGTTYTARAAATAYQDVLIGSDTFNDGVVEWGTPATYSGGTWSGNTFRFTAAGTYDFSGADFLGTITFVNASAGAVTVSIPLGVDYVNSGPSITIIEPQVYQSVTVDGPVAGSLVQLYDIISDAQVYLGTPASYPFTWTDPAPYASDRQIRIRVAQVDGATAKAFVDQTIGTATYATPALSVLIAQENNTTYNANGVDGNTVTGVSIVDGTLLVELDAGGWAWDGDTFLVPLPDLYAYQVAWLATEAGIVDEGSFIDAPDTANYTFENFKLKNVTSPTKPITIIGGYAKDATTGRSATLIDPTGGVICFAPDHVVPYAVSGTPVITGDIADLPTASEIAAAVTPAVWEHTATTAVGTKGADLKAAKVAAQTAAALSA
jgi:hypothetical protein